VFSLTRVDVLCRSTFQNLMEHAQFAFCETRNSRLFLCENVVG